MELIIKLLGKRYMSFYYLLFIVLTFVSCEKQNGWLDKKSSISDIVPHTIKDLQGILDNNDKMNISPGISVVGTDNLYMPFSNWQFAPAVTKNAYVWASDIFQGASNIDWNTCFQTIMSCNVVLEGLHKIESNSTNQSDLDQIKGAASFYRAKAYADLSSLFIQPYDINTASSDLGLPIRLSADVNSKTSRETIQRTYEQIISDLKQAEILLPLNSAYQTRPSKTAAQAMLARVYLYMNNYVNAGIYANAALANYSFLIDFNDLPNSTFPFSNYPNNKEVIFWSRALGYSILNSSVNSVDTNLFKSYNTNDLRKTKFFKLGSNGRATFVGAYTGTAGYPFSGIATNELYFIRAECYARQGNITLAMADLNTIMKKRWSNSIPFPTLTASDANDALIQVLNERRKEMPFNEPIRWNDLRRLNKESQFAKPLTRVLNGQVYILPPNDNKYVYPIPPDEVKLSGIQQNPR